MHAPRDDRDDDQRQADNDNHSVQCNPNNDTYWEDRGYDGPPMTGRIATSNLAEIPIPVL